MESIIAFLLWYLILQLISLLTFPLVWTLFSFSPDRGVFFVKSAGILWVGFVLWIGTAYGLLRNEVGGAWLALLIVAVLAATTPGTLKPIWDWARSHLRLIIWSELLFLVAFAGWALVRAYDPAVNHTEQPMDLMFLNAVAASPTFPPLDPWLSGYSISYYYLGYWLLNTLAVLAGQPTEIAYNLGQACWFALLLSGSFGLGYNLTASHLRHRGENFTKSKAPSVTGLLAALSVGLLGNLQILLEWFNGKGLLSERWAGFFDVHGFPPTTLAGDDWWWWRSSRVIQDTSAGGGHIEVIDEFPFFSYLLGDNHPHLLAMPFVILVIALGFHTFSAISSLYREPAENNGRGGWRDMARLLPGAKMWFSGALVFTCALLFLNPWDYPPYWLLMVLTVWVAWQRTGLGASTRRRMIYAVLLGTALFISGVLILLPFFLGAQSQVRGILPNFNHPTYPPQFFLMFGTLLPGLILLIRRAWREKSPAKPLLVRSMIWTIRLPVLFLAFGLLWFTLGPGIPPADFSLAPETSLAGAVAFRLTRSATFFSIGLGLSLIIALGLQRCLTDTQQTERKTCLSIHFALLLAGIGLLLLYLPEFVYVHDSFGTRMNTVFKFYYQAWLLLAVSGAFAVVLAWREQTRIGAGVALAVMAVGMAYPIAAIQTKTRAFGDADPTLDALWELKRSNPGEWEAARWVRANVPPQVVVLQTIGDSYQPDQDRLTVFTGRPTLLGWQGHELQWRGEQYSTLVAGRAEALEQIYGKGSPETVRRALSEWGINYVYLGPAERARYAVDSDRELLLGEVMEPVFESGNIRIFRRRSR